LSNSTGGVDPRRSLLHGCRFIVWARVEALKDRSI
jgi:hypothetical protein